MKKLLTTSLLVSSIAASQALALDQIIHPYTSIRSEGMGGLKLTTGLYADNFFGNPARVTANPRARFTLFETDSDLNSALTSSISTALSNTTSSTALMSSLSSFAGQDIHGRAQFNLLSGYFHGGGENPKLYFAFGIMNSMQVDGALRQSYQMNPQGTADSNFAVTVGYKPLDDNSLSVGLTPHFGMRASTNSNITPSAVVAGNTNVTYGAGTLFDVDLGGTYALPLDLWGAKWTAGAAFNNLLGGNYSPISFNGSTTAPTPQPRAFGFGGSAQFDQLGVMQNTVVALEVQDIGNSGGGSVFRLIHIGGETHYGVLAARLGINQGYLTAGLGVDTRVVHLDLSTYGEEMSTNAGGFENRVIGFALGLHI